MSMPLIEFVPVIMTEKTTAPDHTFIQTFSKLKV